MFKFSEQFLNTQCAFVLDKKMEDMIFLKPEKNRIFYGIHGDLGIFYDIKKDKIDFSPLAINKKI